MAGAGVPQQYVDACAEALRGQTPQLEEMRLDDSEAAKTLQGPQQIWDRLAQLGYGRDAVLYALGGGVTSDMVGFAAAAWNRGCDFVVVPTTLLAQVDASVGGKTGVNLPQGKNLVGAFHQPRGVLIDTGVVRSQPRRDLLAGMAEVLKYGLACERGFFDWLEQNLQGLVQLREEQLGEAVRRSCEIKAAVVARDAREQTGARALLNFGHTLGHAIEAVQGYGGLNHGEAVGVGMAWATRLSARLGLLEQGQAERGLRLLQDCGLEVRIPQGLDPDALLDAMGRDKKNRAGQLRLVLLRGLGGAELLEAAAVGADEAALREALAQA